ncbi:hypothetical protein Cni_G17870 [Canna indica]|uniref:Uncharacterized protein n=1 Tax=Canna indica TaxID=4628 RepID=A0AAQ3KI77_9LILI|nr:hypothetical protein Cni_G17870 [Canna indica]
MSGAPICMDSIESPSPPPTASGLHWQRDQRYSSSMNAAFNARYLLFSNMLILYSKRLEYISGRRVLTF